MGRARNSQKSDTRLPPVPYSERRGIRPVPAVPAPPVTGTGGGDAPEIDTDYLETFETMEVAFTYQIELLAGDDPLTYHLYDPDGNVTINPRTGLVFGTVPLAQIYSYEVYVTNPYGSDFAEFEVDAT